ncbi:MAG: hypothetical protein QM528_09415 [Phycisphaerales bacterium]|nr:hypothetical protein [Phycisphaerales bacterium]
MKTISFRNFSVIIVLLVIISTMSCTKTVELGSPVDNNSNFTTQSTRFNSAIWGGGPYYDNTIPTVDSIRNSNFTTAILWSIHVNANGDLSYNNTTIVQNGQYIGNSNFINIGGQLLQAPTTINRVEMSIGSGGVKDFTNIVNLVQQQGVTSTSILYKNFSALLKATNVTIVDFDNEDYFHEDTPVISFAQMLSAVGYQHLTISPFFKDQLWIDLYNELMKTNHGFMDGVYFQVYGGGMPNVVQDFVHDFTTIPIWPGLWCKGDSSSLTCNTPIEMIAQFTKYKDVGAQGGFIYLLDDILKYEFQTHYSIKDYAGAVNKAFN